MTTENIGTEVSGMDLNRILTDMVKSIVENPDEVVVNEKKTEDGIVFTLSVAPDDTGMIIGRHGNIANALRTVLRAAAKLSGEKVVVEIK